MKKSVVAVICFLAFGSSIKLQAVINPRQQVESWIAALTETVKKAKKQREEKKLDELSETINDLSKIVLEKNKYQKIILGSKDLKSWYEYEFDLFVEAAEKLLSETEFWFYGKASLLKQTALVQDLSKKEEKQVISELKNLEKISEAVGLRLAGYFANIYRKIRKEFDSRDKMRELKREAEGLRESLSGLELQQRKDFVSDLLKKYSELESNDLSDVVKKLKNQALDAVEDAQIFVDLDIEYLDESDDEPEKDDQWGEYIEVEEIIVPD